MPDMEMKTEAEQVIMKHSCINGALMLVPIPLAPEIGVIANQAAMYANLTNVAGVKFSAHLIRHIGMFLASQMAGMGVVLAADAALKFIPGINFIAGFATAPLAGVGNYVCGKVYFNMLDKFVAHGGANMSEIEAENWFKSNVPSKDVWKALEGEAKKRMKDVNYEQYKNEATNVANAAKRNSDDYE